VVGGIAAGKSTLGRKLQLKQFPGSTGNSFVEKRPLHLRQ